MTYYYCSTIVIFIINISTLQSITRIYHILFHNIMPDCDSAARNHCAGHLYMKRIPFLMCIVPQ